MIALQKGGRLAFQTTAYQNLGTPLLARPIKSSVQLTICALEGTGKEGVPSPQQLFAIEMSRLLDNCDPATVFVLRTSLAVYHRLCSHVANSERMEGPRPQN
jgi:hypothetical protein